MQLEIIKTTHAEIEGLRKLLLAEMPFQFVYDKCHGAGWADTYLFTVAGSPVGHGALWGKDDRENRDTVFEFYLSKPFRHLADRIFPGFLKESGARFFNCQSNDAFLVNLLFEYAKDINAEAILFEDCFQTEFKVDGTVFRKSEIRDSTDSEYVLVQHGEVVASGGYVWNYNYPYIDIYYEVKAGHRRKGLGSFITQELKKEAYRLSRIPSARCNISNKASKATLLKAGMRVCGHMLFGRL